jgi:hypothetical protein
VGNSDVPYPFAVDSEYVYLMIEDVKIPVRELDLVTKPLDVYTQYYGYLHYKNQTKKKYTTAKLGRKIIIPRE